MITTPDKPVNKLGKKPQLPNPRRSAGNGAHKILTVAIVGITSRSEISMYRMSKSFWSRLARMIVTPRNAVQIME